jgi:hypothetical protein
LALLSEGMVSGVHGFNPWFQSVDDQSVDSLGLQVFAGYHRPVTISVNGGLPCELFMGS